MLYYHPETGERESDMDSDVAPEYALSVSHKYNSIAEWSCRNGDPRDVRYYRDGRQIEEKDLPAAMREKG